MAKQNCYDETKRVSLKARSHQIGFDGDDVILGLGGTGFVISAAHAWEIGCELRKAAKALVGDALVEPVDGLDEDVLRIRRS